MEDIPHMDTNLCCNIVLKLRCWLILAKYGASKLDTIKQMTQDVALDEFETRLYLKKRFSETSDIFTLFFRKVYEKTLIQVTNYICLPDWSIFLGNGNDSIWLLKTVIENEMMTATTSITPDSHDDCANMFYNTKKEIFSVIDSWSNIMFTFSNYINASLSYIYASHTRDLILRYEDLPQSMDIRWLCEDILKSSHHPWSFQSKPEEEKNCLFFVTETLGFHFFDDGIDFGDEFHLKSEEELSQLLADWLFKESVDEFRTNTKRVLDFNNDEAGARIYDREKLSTLFDMPISNIEHLMTSANEFPDGSNIAEGPHYYVPNTLIELQPCTKESTEERIAKECEQELKSGFDEHDSAMLNNNDSATLNNNDSAMLNNNDSAMPSNSDSILLNNNDSDADKSLDIEVKLEDSCENNRLNIDDRGDLNVGNDSKPNKKTTNFKAVPIPKTNIISGNQVQKTGTSSAHSTKRHRRRGRPRKVDEFNQASSKHSQHKYSQQNVSDCSTWIRDNFYEVTGNKPAIDRARLYELYTNYCLLKLCTPVDRALFGKIIRKVFPKLRSRRLIQNQVLKYHYVGLKPKFAELEQILLYADSSLSPTEVVLTYTPVDD